MNRRAFLTTAVLLPIAGLAVVSRLGRPEPFIASQKEFDDAVRATWDRAKVLPPPGKLVIHYRGGRREEFKVGTPEYYAALGESYTRELAASFQNTDTLTQYDHHIYRGLSYEV